MLVKKFKEPIAAATTSPLWESVAQLHQPTGRRLAKTLRRHPGSAGDNTHLIRPKILAIRDEASVALPLEANPKHWPPGRRVIREAVQPTTGFVVDAQGSDARIDRCMFPRLPIQ